MPIISSQGRKQKNWLFIFVGLFLLSILNCGVDYTTMLPPREGVPILYWPRILYNQIAGFSILFFLFCFLIIVAILIKQRKWLQIFIIFVAAVYCLFGSVIFLVFAYRDAAFFTHVDSAKLNGRTYHLGVVDYADGGAGDYFVFCEGDVLVQECRHIYHDVNLLYEGPILTIVPEAAELRVHWDGETIYRFDVEQKHCIPIGEGSGGC